MTSSEGRLPMEPPSRNPLSQEMQASLHSTMSSESIVVDHVTKTFGPKVAVNGISLGMEAGEIRGLLGPNGSGKSTTMRMIMGIMKPDSGRITLCGIDVLTDAVSAKRLVGYVPESPYLYEYLTASEYLDFVGTAYGIPRPIGGRGWLSCWEPCRCPSTSTK